MLKDEFMSVQGGLPVAPLFDPAYKANPYPWYREWTARPPFWALVAGKPAVIAARHADVGAIYRDHERFSSVKPLSSDMARFDFFNGLRDMVHTDPPDHTRLRRIVNPTFAPGSIAQLSSGIQSVIDRLLHQVKLQSVPFDLMADIARPLSLEVLLGVLLNIPQRDYPIFQAMTEAMALLGESQADGSKPAAYLEAWARGEAYCRKVIANQLHEPTDDVIGAVVRAHRDGILSESEVLVMVINLFVGGLSTIATAIGNAFVQILSRPDQHTLLRQEPERAGDASDEVLRYDSPGLFNYKFASRDLEFEGLAIPRDTIVYLVHQATGFDPTVFRDPERFDITRRPRNYLSFGYGVHFCIGTHLARLVMRLVLASAMRDLPELSLVPDRPITYGGWEQERAPLAVWIRMAR